MALTTWMMLAALAFLVQTHLSLFSIPLNLSILVVYAFALRHLPTGAFRMQYALQVGPELKSTIFGAAVGLFEDVLAGGIIGPQLFSKGTVAFVTALTFNDILFRWTPLLGICAISVLHFLDGAIGMGLRMLFTHLSVGWENTLYSFAVQVLVTLPFGVLIRPLNPD
jgi:hypothetical protein